MSTGYNEVTDEDWKKLPLCTVLYEWLIKNISMPTDMSMFVAYLCVFLIIWYCVVWITRFVMSVMWPMFFIILAIIVYRVLLFYEIDDIKSILQNLHHLFSEAVVGSKIRKLVFFYSLWTLELRNSVSLQITIVTRILEFLLNIDE